MTERRLIRWVLFAVPAIFAGQYPFKREYGEPYPSLMMPGFASSAKQASYNWPTLVLLSGDNEIEERPIADLFGDVARTSQVVVTSNHLRPGSIVDPDAREWMLERVSRLNPEADRFAVRWTKHFYPPSTAEPAWQGDLLVKR